MNTTRFVGLRFDNWVIGAAICALGSALSSGCGSSNDTYVAASGGSGGNLMGSGGNVLMGSGGEPGGSDDGSAGSNSGGQSSGGAGGQAGSSLTGGFGGVSGSINIGGGSGSGNAGGASGFSGSGNVGGAAGIGGASDSAGSSGSAGASGASGASGSGGSGGTGTVDNLIVNGDFSQGEAHWEFTLGAGTLTHAVISGRLCITLNSYGAVIVGWPLENALAPALSAGGSYTLSYTAYSTQPGEVSLTTKVGHAVSPYTPIIEQARTLTGTPQPFTHTFTTVSGDSGAGIAFNLIATYYASNNNICFDDVSLAAN